MSKLLVHITCGPENPTKAALGFLVARTALSEGHEVNLFLAGDGVQLMRSAVLDTLVGLGTGSLREHFDANGQFYVSGMSSQGRGITASDLDGKSATMAMPEKLVALALAANTTITY